MEVALPSASSLSSVSFSSKAQCSSSRETLPTTMDSIEYFGPHPPPGALVDCVAHCTELTDDAVRADLELLVDGVLWCRIQGWEDRACAVEVIEAARRKAEAEAG